MTNGHIVAYVILGLFLLIAVFIVIWVVKMIREIRSIAEGYREIQGSFVKIANLRRIALIEKGAANGLSKNETEELAVLQKFMDRYAYRDE